jgi:hypothetical protein
MLIFPLSLPPAFVGASVYLNRRAPRDRRDDIIAPMLPTNRYPLLEPKAASGSYFQIYRLTNGGIHWQTKLRSCSVTATLARRTLGRGPMYAISELL